MQQHSFSKVLWLTCLLLTWPAWAAELLPTPTLELRIQAATAFSQAQPEEGEALLHDAILTAQSHPNPYVRANELRYIGTTYANAGLVEKARAQFAASMETANTIPTWNHRLYASIGVVEMQRATGDLQGVHDNGLLAIRAGLLNAIAETGEAAEMGRFFTALSGTLNAEEIAELRTKIRYIGNETFRAKALHALNAMEVAENSLKQP